MRFVLKVLAGLGLALSPNLVSAQTVMVQVPADTKPMVKPSYYCRIQIPTLGGRYYAGRTLDANGQFLGDSISWSDGHVGDLSVNPQIDIKWWAENAPHSFEKGWVNFVMTAQKPVGYYLQLSFNKDGATDTYSREAGPLGGPDSSRAIGYFPISDIFHFAGDKSHLKWRLHYLKKYQGKVVGTLIESDFSLEAFKDAEAVFDQITPALEAKQSQYKTACTTQ